MNDCRFMGNLTRDVELKNVGNTKVGSFGLAVSRKYKLKDGTEKVETNFFDIEVWDKQADIIEKYFKKGSPIILRASAKQETWDDKATGSKRSKIKFRLEEFWFVPKQPKSHQNSDNGDTNGGDEGGSAEGNSNEDTPF